MRAINRMVQKEFLVHILTFRFAFMILICQALVLLNIYAGVMKYKERLDDYNIDQRKLMGWIDEGIRPTYFKVFPESIILSTWWVQRKPEFLSCLAEGCEADLGKFVRANHKYVPYIVSHSAEHPILPIKIGTPGDVFGRDFQRFDLALTFQIILSLFAILLVHDLVSGEKEMGTLRLMASQGISRGAILLAKYLGAMAVLLIPLTMSFLTSTIYLYLEFGKEIGIDEAIRLLLFYIASMVYLSLFVIFGIFISATTRRSSTSLILGLFSWLLLVVIWPNAMGFVVKNLYNKIPSDEPVKKRIDLIKEGYSKEAHSLRLKYPHLEGIGALQLNDPEGVDSIIWKENLPPDQVHILYDFKRIAREIEVIGMRYSEKIWDIRKGYLERYPYRLIRLAWALNRISPAGAYYELISILSRTDWGSYLFFLDTVRKYRDVLQRWVINDSISSTRWFTEIIRKADPSRIPRFEQQEEGIASGLVRARADLVILLLLNVLCFVIAYFKVSLYDVR